MAFTVDKSDDDVLSVPVSTGEVEFDGSPVTTEAIIDNGSTGAVALGGPVTTTLSWLGDVETKPIEAPEAKPLGGEVETKPVSKPTSKPKTSEKVDAK